MSTSTTLPVASWFVASNGNAFADINDSRYCVALINGRDNNSGYLVMRNGVEIAGPTCTGAPAGFRTEVAAKRHAEWHADMNPRTYQVLSGSEMLSDSRD